MEGEPSGSVLRCRKSAVRVEVSATRITFGLAWWVKLIHGVKFVVPAEVLIVVAGVLVAHQLLVAVTVLPKLLRLLPVGAVLFASRLKLMVSGPLRLKLPDAMPPPVPVAELPVMVTLVSEAD